MASKVFLIRHGQTEWSLNQQHTGSTEVPLTSNGERQVKALAKTAVGDGKLIQPKKICHIYCSPRGRARQTLDLLDLGVKAPSESYTPLAANSTLSITENLHEWDYGEYEGLTIAEVRNLRKSRGLDKDKPWNIWKDGCEGGESPEQVSARLDKLIADIKQQLKKHSSSREGAESGGAPDIVCVAHGHILSALALRWAEQPLNCGMRLLIETAGVGTLCFEHNSLEEPGVMLGATAE